MCPINSGAGDGSFELISFRYTRRSFFCFFLFLWCTWISYSYQSSLISLYIKWCTSAEPCPFMFVSHKKTQKFMVSSVIHVPCIHNAIHTAQNWASQKMTSNLEPISAWITSPNWFWWSSFGCLYENDNDFWVLIVISPPINHLLGACLYFLSSFPHSSFQMARIGLLPVRSFICMVKFRIRASFVQRQFLS